MTDLGYEIKLPSFSTKEELIALLKEAEEDGPDVEMTPLEWQRLYDDVERDALLRRKAS